MNDRGYFIIAQNNQEHDYVRMAYALALSIVAKSPKQKVSLITNDTVDESYKKVFDQIIPIPWDDSASKSKYAKCVQICYLVTRNTP